jgi:hypothetical protein
MPNALKNPLLAQTRRAPTERAGHPPAPNVSSSTILTTPFERLRRRPACLTTRRDLSGVPSHLQLARCTIERIGTAQCDACSKAWIFADIPDYADIEDVGSELRHFAKILENHISGASRGF